MRISLELLVEDRAIRYEFLKEAGRNIVTAAIFEYDPACTGR
jgi:hypothetical protein